MIGWLENHWFQVVLPLLAFITVVVIGLWARFTVRKVLTKPQPKITRIPNSFIIESLWNPFLFWFILLGVYLAVEISKLSQSAKTITERGLGSLFVLSLMWTAIRLSGRLIRFYIGKTEAVQSLTSIALNIARITVIVIGLLILFDIWGIPTFPITLVLITSLFIIVLTFRNTLDNFLAGLEIAYGEHIKVGHFIKLASGETGHISKISWTRTVIQTNEGNLVIIPNYKLMANIIINHGTVVPETPVKDVQTTAVAIKPSGLIDILSDREREVLRLIGNGATNREIAEKLIISENTAKSHLRSILSKLNLRNRQQAAALAEREGLGSSPKTQ